MIETIHAFATLIGMLVILLIIASALEVIWRSIFAASVDTYNLVVKYQKADQEKRDKVNYFYFRAVRYFFKKTFKTALGELNGVRRVW